MADVTFRDFAGAIMGNDTARAGEVLQILLGVSAEAGVAASAYFHAHMTADPSFMAKTMGLRAAVTSGTDAEIAALLGDCFGLTGDAIPPAVTTLRRHYPAPSA
jgi:uncharacterized protein (DUF2345 family)